MYLLTKENYGDQIYRMLVNRIQLGLEFQYETIMTNETEKRFYDFVTKNIKSDVRISFVDRIPEGDYYLMTSSSVKKTLKFACEKQPADDGCVTLYVCLKMK